jgi:MshEN domain
MPFLSRMAAGEAQGVKDQREDRRLLTSPNVDAEPNWPGRKAPNRRKGVFAACANPECRSGWLQVWRRRETPSFEGGWCCCEECMAVRVGTALAREMDGRGNPQENHRHRIPLGLAMLEQGWITQEGLRAALAAQRASRTGKLGWWLVRQRSASEARVTRALGLQWGCPVLDIQAHTPEGLAALMPRLFVDAFGALPLRVATGKILYLGFTDRLDPALALALERVTGLRVECGLVEESRFRAAHSRMLEARFGAVELLETATRTALAAALTKVVERTRPVEARLVRVHDCFWLRMWLRPQNGPVPNADTIRDVIGSAGPH